MEPIFFHSDNLNSYDHLIKYAKGRHNRDISYSRPSHFCMGHKAYMFDHHGRFYQDIDYSSCRISIHPNRSGVDIAVGMAGNDGWNPYNSPLDMNSELEHSESHSMKCSSDMIKENRYNFSHSRVTIIYICLWAFHTFDICHSYTWLMGDN